MRNYLIFPFWYAESIKAIWMLICRTVGYLTQRMRVLRASMPVLCPLKSISQPKAERLYIKYIIPVILIGLANISLAQNTVYRRQTPPVAYRQNNVRKSNNSSTINNPYNAEDYMRDLASKLSPEQRNMLLGGKYLQKDTSRAKAGMKGPKSLFAIEADEGPEGAEWAEDVKEAWSLQNDLEKYRAYSVKEGSRYPEENLQKFFLHAGLFLEDGMNIFTLGYGSDRGIPFRANDGNDPLWQAGTVLEQAGLALVNFTDGVYSIIDLMAFDGLADIQKDVYKDNNPIVRPFIFTGRTIGHSWKTAENIGNTLTWGYFDNVSGSAAMCVGDIIECVKHGGQAVTNLPRELLYLTGDVNEDTDKMLDWLLVVPWEFASNVIEMQGIANTHDYKTAFKEKGVVGSLLEMAGSSAVIYKSIDELVDELDDDNDKHATEKSQTSSGTDGSGGGGDSTGGEDDGIYYFLIIFE